MRSQQEVPQYEYKSRELEGLLFTGHENKTSSAVVSAAELVLVPRTAEQGWIDRCTSRSRSRRCRPKPNKGVLRPAGACAVAPLLALIDEGLALTE